MGSQTITYISLFNATIANFFKVPVCGKLGLYVAPNPIAGWVLLGETSKIVKMSEQWVS